MRGESRVGIEEGRGEGIVGEETAVIGLSCLVERIDFLFSILFVFWFCMINPIKKT